MMVLVNLMKQQENLWNKDFILTMLTGFLSAMVLYATMTTMAAYSMERLSVSEGMGGFASSISMFGGILGRLYTGRFLDRVGRRKLALLCSAANAAVCCAYFLPVSLPSLLVIRFLHGVTFGSMHNTMATSVVEFIPLSRRAEGIAIYTLNFTVATAFGPMMGIYLANSVSYTALWAANLGFAFAAFLVVLPIRIRTPDFTEEQLSHIHAKMSLGSFFEKSALPLASMIILLSVCYTGMTAFTESYTAQLGIPQIASVFFLIYGLFIIVTRPFAGRLVDRRGDNFVMVPTMILNALSFALLGLAGAALFAASGSHTAQITLFVAAALIMAAGFGTILPLGQAIAVKSSPSHRIGTTTSTYFIFSDAGAGIGAALMGTVAEGSSFSAMFFVEVAISLAALAVYWTLHGRKVRKS